MITGLSHLFKWENLHNWWLTKYFFAPLCIYIYIYIYIYDCVSLCGIGKKAKVSIHTLGKKAQNQF